MPRVVAADDRPGRAYARTKLPASAIENVAVGNYARVLKAALGDR
jgi:hypothetical protein